MAASCLQPSMLNDPVAPPPAANDARPWKTALLALTSACLGGIAVVLWHRRELQRMRGAEGQPGPLSEAERAEFI